MAAGILPLYMSNSCLVVSTSSFQVTYSKTLTFNVKKKKKAKKGKLNLFYSWLGVLQYSRIDTERNMLYNSMTDWPRAIQMRELITMLAKEISY